MNWFLFLNRGLSRIIESLSVKPDRQEDSSTVSLNPELQPFSETAEIANLVELCRTAPSKLSDFPGASFDIQVKCAEFRELKISSGQIPVVWRSLVNLCLFNLSFADLMSLLEAAHSI